MGYVIMFLMISLLILIHEFGHFCAAKWVGIPVNQFSIGFGPKLWGVTYKGTEYRISAVPVGGYVMPDVEAMDDYFAFSFKHRVLFAFAGPLANIIAAWTGLLVISLAGNGLSLSSVFVVPVVELWNMTVCSL